MDAAASKPVAVAIALGGASAHVDAVRSGARPKALDQEATARRFVQRPFADQENDGVCLPADEPDFEDSPPAGPAWRDLPVGNDGGGERWTTPAVAVPAWAPENRHAVTLSQPKGCGHGAGIVAAI